MEGSLYVTRRGLRDMPVELKTLERDSYKKRVSVSVITILCIFICTALLLPKFVHADTVDETLNKFVNPEEVADYFTKIIFNLQSGIYIKNLMDIFYSGDVTETIISSLENQSFVNTLKSAVKAIAMLLIVYHMLVSLMKELERGEMTIESWLRVLLAFVIPCVCIIEYDTMINVFSKTGMWMQQILYKNSSLTFAATNPPDGKPVPTCDDLWEIGTYLADLVDYIFRIINGALLFIGYAIITVNIILTIMSGIMSNFIEIVLRHLFMPLAIANISHEGARSAGVRYVRKYLGCYIKIGSIMVAVSAIFFVYNTLCSIPSADIWHKSLFFVLILPVTKQSLKMCSEIISDALGD